MPQMHRWTGWLKKAFASWATRSLAVGALATLIDIVVLLGCDRLLGFPTPVSAGTGVIFGSTVTFILNRHFAFRDHHPELAPQAMKFVIATSGCMVVHATLVGLMRDRMGVPVVLAKIAADLMVFTVGQLLILRYVVFPKKKAIAPEMPIASELSVVLGATRPPAKSTPSNPVLRHPGRERVYREEAESSA